MTLERKWINQLQARWPHVDLRHDTFYDQASRQILTTDMLVEGVHFSWKYFTPQDIGWRTMAVNLSDIAATGGQPQWALVSVGIPSQDSLRRLELIYQGMDECCQMFKFNVVGGDTVRSKETTICATVAGVLAQEYQPGRRNHARPGDIIATSAPHGLSRAGLEALQQSIKGFDKAKQAHLRPMPRLRLGQHIASILSRYAMMDSSDGLADAVFRLAEASNVDIVLNVSQIEIHPEVKELAEQAGEDPLDWVLYGGEDFQLVVALPPETVALFPELQPIGYVQVPANPEKGQGYLRDNQMLTPLAPEKTFQHFETAPSQKMVAIKQEPSVALEQGSPSHE